MIYIDAHAPRRSSFPRRVGKCVGIYLQLERGRAGPTQTLHEATSGVLLYLGVYFGLYLLFRARVAPRLIHLSSRLALALFESASARAQTRGRRDSISLSLSLPPTFKIFHKNRGGERAQGWAQQEGAVVPPEVSLRVVPDDAQVEQDGQERLRTPGASRRRGRVSLNFYRELETVPKTIVSSNDSQRVRGSSTRTLSIVQLVGLETRPRYECQKRTKEEVRARLSF